MELRPDQRIPVPFSPAPVEIKKFESRTSCCLLKVILDDDHHNYKPLRITHDQLTQIHIQKHSPIALTHNAEDCFFLIEVHRIRLAANEWSMASHFDDKFQLYVITKARCDAPQLNRIPNAEAHFRVDKEDVIAAEFTICEDDQQGRVAHAPEMKESER
jgi:hypothetical protein